MTMRSGRVAGALMAATALCAAPAAMAQPQVQPGEQHGLGLLGPDIPDVLKQAEKDPYRPPPEPACVTLPQEIAQLDALLGPDMNQPKDKVFSPSKWVGDAVRHAIPYRGYIRFITGADRKEKELSHAAMAGWARRGFLKGLAAKLDCPGPGQLAQAAAPAPAGEPQTRTLAAQAPIARPTSAPAAEDPTAATIQAPVLIPTANDPEPQRGPAAAPAADSSAVNAVQAGTPSGSRD